MKLSTLFEHLKPPRGFRLTKTGKIFFIFLFGVALAAMATGNNLLFLILAVILTFMIISGIESEWNIRHLEIERILPQEAYAGQPVQIVYALRNRQEEGKRLVIQDIDRLKVPELKMGPIQTFSLETSFRKRGIQQLGNIMILTTYPYGLFEKSITFKCPAEFTVFPSPIKLPSNAVSGRQGEGRGPERESISHIRGYVPGDPLSGIVWKKQHIGLYSRVLEGGQNSGGVIVMRPGGNLELKLSQATYLIGELHESGLPYGLAVNSYFSGLHKSREHKLAILKTLACTDHIGEPKEREIDEPIYI